MMYPAAVRGALPFVDGATKYRERQVKKAIAKSRTRHSSAPDKLSLEKSKAYSSKKNTKSMPQLSKDAASSPRVGRPRFNSMPSLDYEPSITTKMSYEKSQKDSFLVTIKKLFFGKSESKKSKKRYQPQYNQNKERGQSSAIDILCKSRANVNCESTSPPGVSPKRQRTRTVSNISSVMETIEEIPENLVLEDESDSDSETDNDTSYSSYDFSITSESLISSINSILSSSSSDRGNRAQTFKHINSKESIKSLHSSNEILCSA